MSSIFSLMVRVRIHAGVGEGRGLRAGTQTVYLALLTATGVRVTEAGVVICEFSSA